jgi:hypothetical protein
MYTVEMRNTQGENEMTVKSLLEAAGTTIEKLDRKLGRADWAALEDAERAAWLAYQTKRIEKAPKSWGAGYLGRCADGTPMAYFEIDARIKGKWLDRWNG